MNKDIFHIDDSRSIWGSYIDEVEKKSLYQWSKEKNDSNDYWSIKSKKKIENKIVDIFNSYYFDNLSIVDGFNSVISSLEQIDFSHYSSKNLFLQKNYKHYLKEHEASFIKMLEETKFVDGMDNRATTYFERLLTEDRNAVLLWIQELFIQNINQDKIIVKILSLFMDYSYEELYPASQMIALASKNHKSIAVKSSVFSLFGHWCNKESLELLDAYDEPEELWLKIKYDTLKRIIEKRCGI